ncbi:restriction endonuclease subunit S [Xanthomonas axonopodis pv. phyllanthi]|uniref:restriction endonuclease subunit S n=1 Tax=Xanthomonas axonopodis TaxID=53413 RepID=UPI003557B8E8
MGKQGLKTAVPKLRFPEFRKMPSWPIVPLEEIAERISTKNSDGQVTRVLTNSAEFGVLDQRDYFDKDIATAGKVDGYYVVSKGDYVYNPRTSAIAPVGPISRNNLGEGLMSPLYTVFRFSEEKTDFYEHYFKSSGWHSYLRSAASTGARHDRMSITAGAFMRMPVPSPSREEQKKIADCLTSLDEVIVAQGRKVEALKVHKRGLMQQLFPRESETRPRLRFPEFHDAPDWGVKKIGDIFTVTRGEVLAMNLVKDDKSGEAPYPVYSSQTKKGGLAGYFSEFLYENAITWTTDGANAGEVNYRGEKFYCTNVCGVLLSNDGYANPCIAEFLNSITRNYVSYVGNPKLMNGVMARIAVPFPSLAEQRRIADFLLSLDVKIFAESAHLTSLKTHKRGLMQQLFPAQGVG